MRIQPSKEEFLELARSRRVISVYTRLLADDLTPIALYDALCGTRESTYLLESADAGVWSRYSFVGVRTAATLTEVNGRAEWRGQQLAGIGDGNPLEVLAATLRELATPRSADLPPFHAGMVGYLGYDVIRRMERLPDTCTDDLQLPELEMMLTSELAVLDHHTSQVWLIANAINFDGGEQGAAASYERAVQGVMAMVERLRRPRQTLTASVSDPGAPQPHRQRTSEQYHDVVKRTIEHIEAGDAFQVVVSQRFTMDCGADPLDVYRCLRRQNPSPYLYFMRMRGFAIVGSSPEALVQVKDGVATTRPIAGSRPRGATEAEDRRLAAELVADPKEKSEHVMLVDLGRNDLGRVCQPGTVQVHEFMGVHRYSHIMHLEAAVSGKLRDGVTALDATLACFPAGTLSGAPKVRAMEIIDQLEVTRRGLYGGVVGYFDFAGDSDVAIAIRTAVIKDGTAYVQSGAGIVADSDPAMEDAECLNKAMAVLRAVQLAEGMTR